MKLRDKLNEKNFTFDENFFSFEKDYIKYLEDSIKKLKKTFQQDDAFLYIDELKENFNSLNSNNLKKAIDNFFKGYFNLTDILKEEIELVYKEIKKETKNNKR